MGLIELITGKSTFYRRTRKEDRCVNCGKPAEGKFACLACRERRNKYYRTYRRHWRKNK